MDLIANMCIWEIIPQPGKPFLCVDWLKYQQKSVVRKVVKSLLREPGLIAALSGWEAPVIWNIPLGENLGDTL